MGKGSSSSTSYKPADSGSATGELTEAQRNIPLAPNPVYQAYAGQPFNENIPIFPSFLPKDPNASATGLTQTMLDAIMGISSKGKGYVAKGADTTPKAEETTQPAMTLPKLTAPAEGTIRGRFQQQAQGLVDAYNKNPTLEGYLETRDQLAELMRLGQFTRGHGSGGFTMGSSHGGSYGSSAGSSGGGRLA